MGIFRDLFSNECCICNGSGRYDGSECSGCGGSGKSCNHDDEEFVERWSGGHNSHSAGGRKCKKCGRVIWDWDDSKNSY